MLHTHVVMINNDGAEWHCPSRYAARATQKGWTPKESAAPKPAPTSDPSAPTLAGPHVQPVDLDPADQTATDADEYPNASGGTHHG